MIALLFALVVAALWHYYPAVLGSNWEDEVPPRANADGTIDYVLMQKSKNVEGHYWVMRLPKEISVRRSQNRNLGQFSTGGISAGLKETANSYIVIDFFKDSLRPALLADNLSEHDSLVAERTYNAMFRGWYVLDDGPNMDIKENFETCREEPSSSPRVRIFSYDENIERSHAPKRCYVSSLAREGYENKDYVIADTAGKYLGDFECTFYQDDPIKKCGGFVNLSLNNHVQLTVNVTEIDPQKLAELADAARAFFTKHLLERGTLDLGQKYKFKERE